MEGFFFAGRKGLIINALPKQLMNFGCKVGYARVINDKNPHPSLLPLSEGEGCLGDGDERENLLQLCGDGNREKNGCYQPCEYLRTMSRAYIACSVLH